MRLKFVLTAISFLLIASLLLWRLLPPHVLVVMPVRGPAVEAVYATGTVEPSVMIPIAPRISSHIEELKVDEGDKVKAGDLLARLDDAEARANLNDFTTHEALARLEFDRVSRLDRGLVSRADFDKAQSALLSASAARRAAEARVGYLNLTAPSDGIVIRRDGEVGELIPVNQPIFWLSGSEALRISAEVDEEDISQVKAGSRVLIRADAIPGQVVDGKVESITPKGDPVARSFRVRISFDSNSPLQIGMTAETNIIIRETNSALLVPGTALLQDSLWLLKDGRLHKRQVVLGARGSEQTEIKSGLAEGELVVAAPSPAFTEGMRAREKLKS